MPTYEFEISDAEFKKVKQKIDDDFLALHQKNQANRNSPIARVIKNALQIMTKGAASDLLEQVTWTWTDKTCRAVFVSNLTLAEPFRTKIWDARMKTALKLGAMKIYRIEENGKRVKIA